MSIFYFLSFFVAIIASPVQAISHCKTTPLDAAWPTQDDWSALNRSVNGMLLRTTPVASSCWLNNPFDSTVSCNDVKANWSSAAFHAELPESLDYPMWANSSCIPPGATGYKESRGCDLGGLPEYILNATSKEEVATALQFASERNIRIVVKGTGHDMNGRSSGAFSLSIWTHNLNKIEHHPSWELPSGQQKDTFVVGSGQTWGDILDKALSLGRVVTTGQDPSVGIGGYIQGGGHGPLSSTYGLAAHQVLQVTIVTPDGCIFVANDRNNTDLFWAVRGGGGGQFGVVTEYVIETHPAPNTAVLGTLSIVPNGEAGVNASWDAAASLMAAIPDFMDQGLGGAGTLATGQTASKFSPTLSNGTNGVAITQVLFGYNMAADGMSEIVQPFISELRGLHSNATLTVAFSATVSNYTTFYSAISGSGNAGSASLMSSRLLGRKELAQTPKDDVIGYLKTACLGQNATHGSYVTIGMQGGPVMSNISQARWGSVNPVWRSTYVHMIATGADFKAGTDEGPMKQLTLAGDWINQTKESMWQQWAPGTGAYGNEANPFNRNWKHDFYGTSYDRLLEIKQKYDPSFSMFVYNGVGTESWDYDLNSGLLTYWRPFALSSSKNVKSVLQSLGGLDRLENLRYKSAFQLDPPSEDEPYGAVHAKRRDSYTTYQYNILKPGDPGSPLRIPANKGKEAMVYLSFIIDNYDALPWSVIFLRGHLDAWHQENTAVNLIHSLNRNQLARAGYISLRCDWFPSCPAELRPKDHDAVVWGNVVLHEDTEKAVSQSWRQLFPNEHLPETIAAPCCAQFAVTRQAILRRSKADFERMRQWLIETLMTDELSGRVFEKLWAYIFTGEAVNCPPPQMCACKYFGRCEPQVWERPLPGIEIPDWP
ncbi:FAD-binding domain-containing protein [Hortaea werneckii]|nr:FAD-binding domain-containing protein [Hortaea werneckii]KAI7582849.1 FAD-binding domain-containing protein [Hortaea werneckii]